MRKRLESRKITTSNDCHEMCLFRFLCACNQFFIFSDTKDEKTIFEQLKWDILVPYYMLLLDYLSQHDPFRPYIEE